MNKPELPEHLAMHKFMKAYTIAQLEQYAKDYHAWMLGDPVAWGMPDVQGNIVESIHPSDKTGETPMWEDQYSVPLYAPKE